MFEQGIMQSMFTDEKAKPDFFKGREGYLFRSTYETNDYWNLIRGKKWMHGGGVIAVIYRHR